MQDDGCICYVGQSLPLKQVKNRWSLSLGFSPKKHRDDVPDTCSGVDLTDWRAGPSGFRLGDSRAGNPELQNLRVGRVPNSQSLLVTTRGDQGPGIQGHHKVTGLAFQVTSRREKSFQGAKGKVAIRAF